MSCVALRSGTNLCQRFISMDICIIRGYIDWGKFVVNMLLIWTAFIGLFVKPLEGEGMG